MQQQARLLVIVFVFVLCDAVFDLFPRGTIWTRASVVTSRVRRRFDVLLTVFPPLVPVVVADHGVGGASKKEPRSSLPLPRLYSSFSKRRRCTRCCCCCCRVLTLARVKYLFLVFFCGEKRGLLRRHARKKSARCGKTNGRFFSDTRDRRSSFEHTKTHKRGLRFHSVGPIQKERRRTLIYTWVLLMKTSLEAHTHTNTNRQKKREWSLPRVKIWASCGSKVRPSSSSFSRSRSFAEKKTRSILTIPRRL